MVMWARPAPDYVLSAQIRAFTPLHREAPQAPLLAPSVGAARRGLRDRDLDYYAAVFAAVGRSEKAPHRGGCGAFYFRRL
jgi:hypothetical protein